MTTDLIVTAAASTATRGELAFRGRVYPCALGRSGMSGAKREGDGTTPVGRFVLRRVLYRADRVAAPDTALPIAAIRPEDGWCDDPGHADYNRPVALPHPARHETMWRADHLYDVVVVLGHNDSPPVAGAGSAVFLHVAKPGYAPTEGCVALARDDLLAVLRGVAPGSALCVQPPRP